MSSSALNSDTVSSIFLVFVATTKKRAVNSASLILAALVTASFSWLARSNSSVVWLQNTANSVPLNRPDMSDESSSHLDSSALPIFLSNAFA